MNVQTFDLFFSLFAKKHVLYFHKLVEKYVPHVPQNAYNYIFESRSFKIPQR